MAGTDSAGVNERLNGLITLLQTVGIDGVDSNALLEQQGKSKGNVPKKKPSPTTENNVTSSDAQILEMVKRLQQAQADSPEILEALKSPELLALASLAAQAQKQGLQASAPEPPKPAATSLDDVMDDDDNYPKIGPGYSDDISVVSELSTGTVMTRQQISDEEYYREVKAGGQGVPPSMQIGIGGGLAGGRLARTSRGAPNRAGLGVGKVGAGKTKNMVGQVRPLTSRRPVPAIPAIPAKTGGGGAAAQRRLNYQMAMSKLEADGFGGPTPDLPQPTSPVGSDSKKTSKAPSRSISGSRSIGSGSGGGSSKRKPRSINSKIKNNGDEIDWGMTDEDGWPTFDDGNNNSSSADLFVDSEGFFSDNVFASNDGSVGAAPSTSKGRRKKSEKSSTMRSVDGSTSSGGKKKGHRDDRGGSTRKGHRLKKDRDKDGEYALSDDDREGSTRKSHRLKKDKDKDNLSDDGTGGSSRKTHKVKKEKEKGDKSGRRKTRRASMM